MVYFKIRDNRSKERYGIDDAYLNGFAKHLDPYATAVYNSLCRHADFETQECFPSQEMIAKQHNIGVRTVKNKIKLLNEFNIISIRRKRNKKGQYIHNLYVLQDKSVWRKPGARAALGKQPGASDDTIQGHLVPPKVTHNKDTHILVGVPTNTEKEYGNPKINELIKYFKEKLKLPALDGSQKKNRQYANLLLKKFNGLANVKKLIDYASEDEFWCNKMTSLINLYYKGIQIISKRREGGHGIDATRHT